MTNFDKYFKNATMESISDFLDAHGMYDDTPWMNWWDKNYCSKCDSVKAKYEDVGIEPICGYGDSLCECAYCEVYDNCRFFPDKKEVPSMRDILMMWLQSEVDDGEIN